MNYKMHYDKLTSTRALLNRTKSNGIYYEEHHIIPKSIGGTNDKNNLVLLTFKEHFIAHLLLSKMYDGDFKRKMYYALWRMSSIGKNHQRVLSSSQYEICRLAGQKAKENHIVTKETREKISKAHKGKTLSEKTKKLISNKLIGGTHTTSDETKKKISNANLGKKRSESTNNKNRERNLGKKQTKETKEKRSQKLLGLKRPKDVIEKIINNSTLKRKVWCSNGKIYDGLGIAARELTLSQSNITAVCNGRRKSTGGYYFKFINE